MVNNKITKKRSYLLDGYTFAALLRQHLAAFLKVTSVAQKKMDIAVWYFFFFSKKILSCKVPTFRDGKLVHFVLLLGNRL